MLHWIRWSGLSVFALVVTLLVLFWWMLAPWLIEWSIESSGEKLFGAKVEVSDVDLSFSPLGFELIGLSVADKRKPMQNVFSFEKATATTEITPLLMSKFIIPKVVVSGFRLAGERESSGALDKDSTTNAAQESGEAGTSDEQGMSMPSMKLPSVEEVLNKEPLKTIQLAESFQTNYRQSKAGMEKVVASLPSEKKLKEYEQELKSLTQGKITDLADFQQRKARFDALRKEIKQLKQSLSEANTILQEGSAKLQDDYQSLKNAPSEDLAYLKTKYGMNSGGLSNLAQLLAGGDTGETVAEFVRYYQLISPLLTSDSTNDEADDTASDDADANLLKSNEGRYVYFDSENPLPDFWIKELAVDYVDERADQVVNRFDIRVLDISNQQNVTAKPVTFKVVSDRQLNRDFSLSGMFDRRKGVSNDLFELDMKRWPLGSMNLGSNALSMSSSVLDLDASALIDQGVLGAEAAANVSSAVFDAPKQESGVAGSLYGLLSKIKQFRIEGVAQGALSAAKNDLNVKIKSDLDKQLAGAFKSQVSEEFTKFEASIKVKLLERVNINAGDYDQYLAQFADSKGELNQNEGVIDGLLAKKLDSFKEQQKDALKDKLNDKLKGLF